MKREKEILRKQLELLAEQSESATEDELPRISDAMCDIYKVLERPLAVFTLITLCAIMLAQSSASIFVHVKKLFRSET